MGSNVLKTVAIGAVIGAITIASGGLTGGLFSALTEWVGTEAAIAGVGLTSVVAGAIAGGLSAGVLSAVGGLLSKSPSLENSGAFDRLNVTLDPNAQAKWVFGETAVPTDLIFIHNEGSMKEYL